MKRFGYIPYEDPYGVYGNMPEVPRDDERDDNPDDVIATGCLYGGSVLVVIIIGIIICGLLSLCV